MNKDEQQRPIARWVILERVNKWRELRFPPSTWHLLCPTSNLMPSRERDHQTGKSPTNKVAEGRARLF